MLLLNVSSVFGVFLWQSYSATYRPSIVCSVKFVEVVEMDIRISLQHVTLPNRTTQKKIEFGERVQTMKMFFRICSQICLKCHL